MITLRQTCFVLGALWLALAAYFICRDRPKSLMARAEDAEAVCDALDRDLARIADVLEDSGLSNDEVLTEIRMTVARWRLPKQRKRVG